MLKFIGMNKKTVLILAFFLLGVFSFKAEALAGTTPNDFYYKNQWYLNRIGFDYIWNKSAIGDKVIVAIIDSGVNINHYDLKDNIWLNKFEIADNGIDDDRNGFIDDINGWDFVNNISDPNPKLNDKSNDEGTNHGTMIAGIIGASINNKSGISGIASNVKIMSLRALDESGEGKINDVIRAIDYAINNGADIINLSFSGLGYSDGFREVIERAYEAGVIVVAAAGNNSDSLDKNPLYPACFKGNNNENIVIAVSSVDALDQKTSFSSYGKNCVDISAPGISFYSTYFYDLENKKNKSYSGYWSGTSMSAAVISGSLARIKESNPKLSNKEVANVLLKSSNNLNNLNPEYADKLGSGRVNLFSSVNWAQEKWNNLSGYFLLYPQSGISNFETKDEKFNTIRLVDSSNKEKNRFFPFSSTYTGSVNIATGDLNNDGLQEIVVGAGSGGGPHIRIFDNFGKLISQFFAFNPGFRGGVNIAIGDVDGDGLGEIIAGAGSGGGPHVRIFDIEGNIKGQFFAYDSNFKGGVNVAVGDIYGDGKSEIITGTGSGGGPHVRVFSGTGKLISQFFAYENNFTGGIKVEVGNIYGQNTKNDKEIIVSPGNGREPEIKVFDVAGKKLRSIMAFSEKFKNGVNLSISDLNKDAIDEIITGAGPGGTPHVRVFDGKGVLLKSFYGLESNFSGGIIADFIEISN